MNKKERINAYKHRAQTGGVFAIKNTNIDKWYIDLAHDIKAAENRFSFMGESFGVIAADYKAAEGKGFVFEVLEPLQKGETQSEKEFSDDLAVLKSMWLEKLAGQDLYNQRSKS